MKKVILMLAVVTFTAFAFSACGNKSAKTENETTEQVVASNKAYICPMHPEIGSDSPGVCSKCGMDLVENTAMATDSTMMMSMDSVK